MGIVGLTALASAAWGADYVSHRHSVLHPDHYDLEFTLCEDHFPRGSPEHEAVEEALRYYNHVLGSEVSLSIAGWEPHTDYQETRREDETNKIDFARDVPRMDDGGFPASALAHEKGLFDPTPLLDAGKIVECDIVLEQAAAWDPGLPASLDTLHDETNYLRHALAHELGHCLGFDDTFQGPSDLSIMGNNGGRYLEISHVINIGLTAYDHGHVRYHYGAPNPRWEATDILLTNYATRWLHDPDTGRSRWVTVLNDQLAHPHLRGEDIDTGADEYGKDFVLIGNLPPTDAVPGEAVDVHWTLMNRGPTAVPASDGICYQVRIGGEIADDWCDFKKIPPNSTSYETHQITVPDLPLGTWLVQINKKDARLGIGSGRTVLLEKLQIIEPQPDLIVSFDEIEYSTTGGIDSPIWQAVEWDLAINATVTNIGGANSDTDADVEILGNGEVLWSGAVGPLAPNQSERITVDVVTTQRTKPTAECQLNLQLKAVVNGDSKIQERWEDWPEYNLNYVTEALTDQDCFDVKLDQLDQVLQDVDPRLDPGSIGDELSP